MGFYYPDRLENNHVLSVKPTQAISSLLFQGDPPCPKCSGLSIFWADPAPHSHALGTNDVGRRTKPARLQAPQQLGFFD